MLGTPPAASGTATPAAAPSAPPASGERPAPASDDEAMKRLLESMQGDKAKKP
jgi:hypothetical protein